MTDEQINAAIAEACGLKKPSRKVKLNDKGFFVTQHAKLPDYCYDLNAMHEAEKIMTKAQWEDFVEHLTTDFYSVSDAWKDACHATARQRAEAFLRTLDKWETGAKMKITLNQIETLRKSALPLMHWLNDNCHPHCTVMVNSERIEIVEGLATAARLDDQSGERTKMEVQK